AAALAFTLCLDTGDDTFARLQPSALRVELHRTWRTLLSVLAAREPTVVVIDDIHWADPELLELLEELAERSQGRLLFVCPARPELTGTHPSWGGGHRNFSAVFLSPLGDDDATELVGHLLDVDGLGEDTRAAILARAEGNPFFLEEILRQLIDEGCIVQRDGRWTATERLPGVELPDTVQGVLAARIDLLQPREKHTLQQASVVGRIFWRGAVAALVKDDETLDPDLRRLEERELVAARVSSSMVGEEELAFSHILTRDVAYESLPRRERPRAHARVARWIEETTGDRQREYGALLAHHYVEAYRGACRDRAYPEDELEVLRRRAFELLIDASQNADRVAAYRSARALADTALELAATVDERVGALEALGNVARHAAFGDQSWAAFSGAVDALRDAGSTDYDRIGRLTGHALEAIVRWTGTLQSIPDEAVARRYLDSAIENLDESDSEARVRLMTVMAFWEHGYPNTESSYRDPELAVRTGTEAAEMALRLGRPELAVVALDSVQHNLQGQLRYREAVASAHTRIELAKGAGDFGELGDSFAVATWNAYYLGRFQEARAIGREGYETMRADGPIYAVHCLTWMAAPAFHLGDWDAVLAEFELIVSGLGELTEALTTAFAAGWPAAAVVSEARGNRAFADRLLAEIVDIEVRRREGRVSDVLSPLAISTLLLRDDVAAARERLDRVYDTNSRIDNLPLLKLSEAELLVRERRWDTALSVSAEMRELHELSGALYLPPAADALAGRAAIGNGAVEDGVRLLENAAVAYDAAGMVIDAAVARLDVAEAGATDAAALVAAALPPLERAGYVRELARARRLR
ncbi:MAG: ATP-binding protein, partial [Gaiellaceae bacterium]